MSLPELTQQKIKQFLKEIELNKPIFYEALIDLAKELSDFMPYEANQIYRVFSKSISMHLPYLSFTTEIYQRFLAINYAVYTYAKYYQQEDITSFIENNTPQNILNEMNEHAIKNNPEKLPLHISYFKNNIDYVVQDKIIQGKISQNQAIKSGYIISGNFLFGLIARLDFTKCTLMLLQHILEKSMHYGSIGELRLGNINLLDYALYSKNITVYDYLKSKGLAHSQDFDKGMQHSLTKIELKDLKLILNSIDKTLSQEEQIEEYEQHLNQLKYNAYYTLTLWNTLNSGLDIGNSVYDNLVLMTTYFSHKNNTEIPIPLKDLMERKPYLSYLIACKTPDFFNDFSHDLQLKIFSEITDLTNLGNLLGNLTKNEKTKETAFALLPKINSKIILNAIEKNSAIFSCVPEQIKNDTTFICNALKKNIEIYHSLPMNTQKLAVIKDVITKQYSINKEKMDALKIKPTQTKYSRNFWIEKINNDPEFLITEPKFFKYSDIALGIKMFVNKHQTLPNLANSNIKVSQLEEIYAPKFYEIVESYYQVNLIQLILENREYYQYLTPTGKENVSLDIALLELSKIELDPMQLEEDPQIIQHKNNSKKRHRKIVENEVPSLIEPTSNNKIRLISCDDKLKIYSKDHKNSESIEELNQDVQNIIIDFKKEIKKSADELTSCIEGVRLIRNASLPIQKAILNQLTKEQLEKFEYICYKNPEFLPNISRENELIKILLIGLTPEIDSKKYILQRFDTIELSNKTTGDTCLCVADFNPYVIKSKAIMTQIYRDYHERTNFIKSNQKDLPAFINEKAFWLNVVKTNPRISEDNKTIFAIIDLYNTIPENLIYEPDIFSTLLDDCDKNRIEYFTKKVKKLVENRIITSISSLHDLTLREKKRLTKARIYEQFIVPMLKLKPWLGAFEDLYLKKEDIEDQALLLEIIEDNSDILFILALRNSSLLSNKSFMMKAIEKNSCAIFYLDALINEKIITPDEKLEIETDAIQKDPNAIISLKFDCKKHFELLDWVMKYKLDNNRFDTLKTLFQTSNPLLGIYKKVSYLKLYDENKLTMKYWMKKSFRCLDVNSIAQSGINRYECSISIALELKKLKGSVSAEKYSELKLYMNFIKSSEANKYLKDSAETLLRKKLKVEDRHAMESKFNQLVVFTPTTQRLPYQLYEQAKIHFFWRNESDAKRPLCDIHFKMK